MHTFYNPILYHTESHQKSSLALSKALRSSWKIRSFVSTMA